MASRESSIPPHTKTSSRRSGSSSRSASSSVSSTSCSLSSTGSEFQENGDSKERAQRVPIGNGGSQKFLFSRLGAMVNNHVQDAWGERQLGIQLPFQQTMKTVESKHMKPHELEKVKPDEVVYYCAPKQLLYSKETFKHKKAKSSKLSAPSPKHQSKVQHPQKHAYIEHRYSECRCSKGARRVILEVELKATSDALLPYGTLENYEWLSADLASVIRIRDLHTGQTKLLDTSVVNDTRENFKRGQRLWYSAEMDEYFTEDNVKANLKTEADYKHFLANPPKVHSH